MAETDELEPQQYNQLYWDEDVPIDDVRKSTLRKFLYYTSGLCVLLIISGFFVTFPDQVELPFVIRGDRSEEIYRFPYPVFMIEKYVTPGDSVVKGKPLGRITSPEIVLLVNNFREAEQNLQNFHERKSLSFGKQKEMIRARIQQNRSKIEQAEQELNNLNKTWESNRNMLQYESDDASKKYEQNKKLFDEGFISKNELVEFERKKIHSVDAITSAKHEYEKTQLSLTAQRNQLVLENDAAADELSKQDFDSKYDSATLYNQYQLAHNKIKNTFGDYDLADNDLVLKAKENGTVSYCFEGEKEVPASSILFKVIYSHSSVYAWIKSPAALVGRIIKNKKTVLKVSSFPSYEFGTLTGHIDNLSITPDETGNFLVRVIIDDYGILDNMVKVGMDGEAAIIVDEKTFYQYFFLRIKKEYYKVSLKS